MPRRAGWVGVWFALAWTAPAAAQQQGQPNAQQAMRGGGMTNDRELDDARAREHFQIATRYYDEGRFIEAAQQFEEAFELSGRPELQYNAYIAYREAHQARRAAAMLEGYLRGVPDAPDRVNLEARLEELRRVIAQDEARTAQLSDAEERALAQAQRAEQEAAARRAAESAPEAWPWVILGVGGAALIAGAITGGLALGAASTLRSECDAMGQCLPQVNLQARRDEARAMALVGDFLLFGGGLVAATGLILGLVFGLGRSDQSAPRASAACTPEGCQGAIGGVF
ncbi:MAG: hypothetical protein KF729_34585 [Sandaracinaceae bacterium]|nr:hypothetical protein [Sandaracinaceae bacterium]